MSIQLLLAGGALFIFMFVSWQQGFQRIVGELSSNLTSLVPVRPSSSTGSWKSNIGNSLTVIGLSQDVLINSPPSIVMQKQILASLRVVEYKLVELEHLVVTRRLNGASVNRKSTGRLSKCTDSGDNH